MTVSVLRGEDGYQKKEFEELLAWLGTQPKPDIVSLHDSLLIRLAKPIKQALGCAVVCTLQGEDLFLENMAEPWRSQSLEILRGHIADADAYIAVSDSYAAHMSQYLGIPRDKIRVIPLGVNLQGYGSRARLNVGPSLQPPLVLGFLTRIAPEKGLHTLCEAYRILRTEHELPASRLEVAGYLAPDYKSYLRCIERRMKEWGFAREFEYHGQPDRDTKIRFLQRLSVFSVPGTFPGDPEVRGSHFPEPKGLPVIEAMACGIPVVQLRRGTSAEIVEKTGGGILADFDPAGASSVPRAIADGIYSIWKDPALAEQLAARALAGAKQYNAERMAARAIEVYSDILRQPSAAATHAS
jgi:glycosyltransferase involved in cell wall biosynthesis